MSQTVDCRLSSPAHAPLLPPSPRMRACMCNTSADLFPHPRECAATCLRPECQAKEACAKRANAQLTDQRSTLTTNDLRRLRRCMCNPCIPNEREVVRTRRHAAPMSKPLFAHISRPRSLLPGPVSAARREGASYGHGRIAQCLWPFGPLRPPPQHMSLLGSPVG